MLTRLRSLIVVYLMLTIGQGAWAQTLIHSTDWTGGLYGSTTAGAAGSTTGAGDGWIDTGGTLATAGSNNKLILANKSIPYQNNYYLLRPSGEAVRDGQEVVEIPGEPGLGEIYSLHRVQGGNTQIMMGYFPPTSSTPNRVTFFKSISGTLTIIGAATAITAPAANTDIVRITSSVSGAGATPALSIAIYDVTTSTALGSYTVNAAGLDASLQNAGQDGVMWNSSVSGYVNKISTYSLGPGIASTSPTTQNNSTTATITFVGSATHWTTTAPTATVQNTGTTATAGAVTVVDDTHVTVSMTTNGVGGSYKVTLTNGTDGALQSPSITVSGAASIASISPTTIGASSTTSVSVVGTGTHWTTTAPSASLANTGTTATAGAVTVVDDTHLIVPITANGTAGSFILTLTNATDGALAAPSVTVTTAIYTRVDATDPILGINIMLLVPNSLSATPYNSANPTKLIIYCHGSGQDQTDLATTGVANKASVVTALLNAGYILAASLGGSTTNWGNQTSIDAQAGLWRYATANYNISKTAVWSESMGGLAGLGALSQQKIPNIVGFLGTFPVFSLSNLYSIGVYTTAINTAYGITGTGNATYANLTTGLDPALKWGWAFRRVPMRLYSSTGDTVVPKASNTDALATLVGSSTTVTVVPTTGNHGDPSNWIPSEYVAFFNASFASPPATSGGSTYVAAQYVLSGQDRGDGTQGTLTLPAVGSVLNTVTAYGVGGTSLAGTYVPPAQASVLSTATYGAGGVLAGTYIAPTAGQVVSGVAFGPAGALTGTATGGSGGGNITVTFVRPNNYPASLIINWTAVSGNTAGYDITRSVDSGATFTRIGHVAAGTLTFTDTTRPSTGQVIYRVAPQFVLFFGLAGLGKRRKWRVTKAAKTRQYGLDA